jgi:hypothetical protein
MQEIHGLNLGGDEPSVAMAEEGSAPSAEDSTPAPRAESEAPAVEVTLPEASIVEVSTQHERSSPRGVVVAAVGD